jgi:hypothetical protein
MSRNMPALSVQERYTLGLRAAAGHMYQQDKIWSRYSNDKVEIARTLMRVMRTLDKALPLEQPLCALSIGSSNEPQFRILESAFRGGLYLLDIEGAALAVVDERVRRQNTPHVKTLRGDYRALLRDDEAIRHFRAQQLDGRRLTLITLHHSLYYCPRASWQGLLTGLFEHLLEARGGSAIHAVLMASRSDDPMTTTGLYNHFAGKFFGCHNDQDLEACAIDLRGAAPLAKAQVLSESSRVEFFVADFEQFMAVVWMILLHPNVHQFSTDQQREVIDFVYGQLWSRGHPLVQVQDHLVIYRDLNLPGLV